MKCHVLTLLLAGGCARVTAPSPTAGSTSHGDDSPPATSTATDAAGTTSSAGISGSTTGESSSEGSSSTGTVGCVGLHAATSVEVDGTVDPGEWSDAKPYALELGDGWDITVGIKHDGNALLLAFAGLEPPSPPPFAFPELLLDVGNDKATTLGRDDWWFHVSGTDCSATGRLDDYTGCVPEARGWQANNYPPGRLIDVVEISIDFEALGIDPTVEQDLGFVLRASNTQGFFAHWPSDAVAEDPSTWSSLHLCPGAD